MSQRKIAILVLLGAAVIAAAGLILVDHDYTFKGVLYQDPQPAPDFTLTSSTGQFRLSDQHGKLILMFFGYTSCPDVCPATLADMKRVVSEIPGWEDEIVVLFITVDPERDTTEKLEKYISLFNEGFIGLTGSEDELSPVWNSYGVIREVDRETESMAGYLINHTARIYLVDQDGRLMLTYGFGTPSDEILADVEYLIGD
ncbi:MAG: SCO family protein [Anaerolineales bacterium]